jgi:hypothetical protein
LAQALEKNNTLRVVNVETNLITPSGIVRLIKSLLKTKSVEEFRASNQVSKMSWMIYGRGLCCQVWEWVGKEADYRSWAPRNTFN